MYYDKFHEVTFLSCASTVKNERTFKPFWLQGLGEVGAPLKNCGVHFDGGYPRFPWFEH